jgi:hypothetical protein
VRNDGQEHIDRQTRYGRVQGNDGGLRLVAADDVWIDPALLIRKEIPSYLLRIKDAGAGCARQARAQHLHAPHYVSHLTLADVNPNPKIYSGKKILV